MVLRNVFGEIKLEDVERGVPVEVCEADLIRASLDLGRVVG